MNFWEKTKKPIICLAPMADVTDRAFRQIIAKYSKITPHFLKGRGSPSSGFFDYVTWTEFVSADGLFSGGYNALINDLSFDEKERSIIAQFFTSKPEMMKKAAALAVELGFDGVDINMGCPDKSVEKQGAGAGLIKNPRLAREIIAAAKVGIKEEAEKLKKEEIPVSVKTRIGYNKNELETWLPELLAENPAAITIHARTRKEMSLVPARWEHIKRAVQIRDGIQGFSSARSQKCTDIFLLENSSCSAQSASQGISESALSKNQKTQNKTLIIGNGDVKDMEDVKQKVEETGCDGVMLGRAIFGNPWLFASRVPDFKEKLKVLVEHSKLFEKLVQPKPLAGKSGLRQGCGGQGKSFAVMKKHFKAYVNGFPGSKELRIKLMESESSEEVEKVVNDFLDTV